MDDQQKFEAQEKNDFFADGAAMRVPPAGTVARGELWENDSLYRGRDARDSLIASNPLEITLPLLKRGQERFNIYCSPCHGRTGDGRGIMVTRGYIPPPSFHEDRLRAFADGHIFDVISNGIRNMPSYRAQIAAEDRWAIVAYVRALQRSRHAKLEDVPVEKRRNLPVATGM